MPIPATLLDMQIAPVVHDVDERWTMAFAAGLGDHNDHYLDTTRPTGVVAHPLFAVCPEWPAIVASRAISEQLGMTHAEVLTGVHATHDVTVHRLVRPGDRLTTRLSIVGLTDIAPGAKATTRLVTVDADGLPVATTTQDAIYLGVRTDGVDRSDPAPTPTPTRIIADGESIIVTLALAAGAAHVYTECAHIWNPIHTDRAVARAAGLPDIILHGTASLAHAITAVVDHCADGDPTAVRRVIGRFAAMVQLPSVITIEIWPEVTASDSTRTVAFEVRNEQGLAAVANGQVVLDP